MVRRLVRLQGETDLVEVILAGRPSGGFAAGLDRKEQERREEADDGDDHDDFD